jgi:Lrp/AsnC family transcriptional regulator for asnA, asnC and gidA
MADAPAELDETDKAIIRALQLDGRTPYSKLGPAVGLSQAAVRQRVQRLIEGGVMQVVAVTDPATLGFAVQAMVAVCVTGDVRDAAAVVGELEEVEYVVITTGRFDLLVEVVCADNHHLLEVVNDRIRSIPAVRSTECFTYVQLVKQTYSWGVP